MDKPTDGDGLRVLFTDVLPGMVLSREMQSETALLLASRGTTLNPQRIGAVRRYFEIDPPDAERVWVWMDRSGT